MKARVWSAVRIAISFVVPMLAYYALRAAGLDVYLALLITSVVPATLAGARLAVHRRTDGLATFMTVMMVLGAAVSLINGDERLLMARDGWVTAVAGFWFLGSAWSTRPLAYLFARPMLDGRIPRHGRGESWDELWSRLPGFRRIWRVATVVWGIGTLVDAAARVIMAYTLPPDAVPALYTALYAVTSIVRAHEPVLHLRRALRSPYTVVRAARPALAPRPPQLSRGAVMPTLTGNKSALRALIVGVAVAAALLVWLIAVPVAGIELVARSGSGTQAIGAAQLAVVVAIVGLAGWALLEMLERRTKDPVRNWTATALIVLVLSLVGPLGANTAGGALALVTLHLVTAAVLIVGLRRVRNVSGGRNGAAIHLS